MVGRRFYRYILAALWVGGMLFPVEAWARGHPSIWAGFRRAFAVGWLHVVMHVLLFAGAVVLLTPRPCPRRCRWGVAGGLVLLALGQEALQAYFGPFLDWWDAFLDLGLDLLGMALGAAFLYWQRTTTHDVHFDFLVPQVYRLLHFRPPKAVQVVRAGLQPGMRVLDVGGGTGRVVQHLPRTVTAVVLDPSPGMLRAAPKSAFWYRVRGVAEHLPFPPNTFHRVVIVDALHHFAYPEQGLREIWRVLAPGGRVIIEEPDVEHPLGRWIPWMERVFLMRSRFLTAGRIRALFPQALVLEEHHVGPVFRLVLAKPWPDG